VQSVSGYHPSWVKQVVSVRGTVSRVDEKPSMFTAAEGDADLSLRRAPDERLVLVV